MGNVTSETHCSFAALRTKATNGWSTHSLRPLQENAANYLDPGNPPMTTTPLPTQG